MAEQIQHRGFLIRYGFMGQSHAAQVYRGPVMATQRITAATAVEVVDRARAWIDAEWEARIARRRVLRPGTRHEIEVGTVEEYAEFFGSAKLSTTDRAMLTAHTTAPERTMTAGALARAAGWDSYGAANLRYGLLARQVAESLALRLPRHGDGSSIHTCALADAADDDWTRGLQAANFRWCMHDEVAAALGRTVGAPVARR